VVVNYVPPPIPVRNGRLNQVWVRIRALAGAANARVGVEVVNAACEQSQISLRQPLTLQNPERPVDSVQTPPNRIQVPTNSPSNATQSTTHAASAGNPNPTRSVPQRRRYYAENPPTDLDFPILGHPSSSVSTSDRARNPMQQSYQRFRGFVYTITHRRRI
jgi:hypothetical protein